MQSAQRALMNNENNDSTKNCFDLRVKYNNFKGRVHYWFLVGDWQRSLYS